jgi:hypothetical protein
LAFIPTIGFRFSNQTPILNWGESYLGADSADYSRDGEAVFCLLIYVSSPSHEKMIDQYVLDDCLILICLSTHFHEKVGSYLLQRWLFDLIMYIYISVLQDSFKLIWKIVI